MQKSERRSQSATAERIPTQAPITDQVQLRTCLGHLTRLRLVLDHSGGMDPEQTIADIELLERLFARADTRPLSPSDIAAANRRHDEKLAQSPWFKMWQRYCICCRNESSEFRVGEIDS